MHSKFSKRLLEARKKLNISQKVLADCVNISPASLSAYEQKGKYPTLDVAVRLADALNVSLDWLSGRVDEENPVSIEYDKDIAEAFVKITMFENTVAKIGYREIDPRDDDTISESDMDSYCVFGMADDGEYGEFILPSKWATFEIRKRGLIFTNYISQER